MIKILRFLSLSIFLFSTATLSFGQQSQGTLPLSGCTDPEACNYLPAAQTDDGSCAFEGNPAFYAYDYNLFSIPECGVAPANPDVFIFGPNSFTESGQYVFEGEITTFVLEACGNEGLIMEDDGMIFAFLEFIDGQLFYTAFDGSCYLFVPAINQGCTDENAQNYDSEASEDDGSCYYFNACGYAVDSEGNGYGFYDVYENDVWETFISHQGAISISTEEISIIGSNDLFPATAIVEVFVEVEFTGEFSFDWDYITTDDAPFYDLAYFFDETDVYYLSESNGSVQQSGSYTFFAEAGDMIGFGIVSDDNVGGEAYLTISNFRFPSASCVVGCPNPTATNYNPDADQTDWNLCEWINPCGDSVDSNGNGLGFNDEYAIENWLFFTEGNGDVLFNDPDFFDWFGENIMLEGSNTEEGTEVPLLTELSIEIPNTGTHRFWWTVEGIDLFEEDDIAFYTVNDEVFIFEFDFGGASTRGFGFGGYVEIDLNAGDAFSFGIETLTNCCMTPRLIIYGFSWPVDCTGGCFDDSAFNYNPDADYDNEWCTYLNECDEEISAGGNLVGFTNEFSADNWSVLSMGDGYVDINNETLFIFGSDSDEGNDILTQATIVAPISGTYTFNWLYFTIDGSFYDVAYYINDQVMELTEIQDEFGFWFGNSGQSGTVSIEVVEGDVIGFGINAIDDCCGYATLTISQFTYPVTTVCAPGCTDEDACNYNPEANFDDGNCDYTCYGCTDDTALNYDPEATIEDGSCVDECEFPEIDLTAEVCANGVFNIEMTVSNLGNTPPYVVTNNVDASVLTISETGSYMYGPFSEEDEIELTVTSVVAPDCNFTFETIACETTVLELNALAFGLFPNPASDQVIIRSASDRQVEVILFDMAGKIVFNTSLMTHATGSAIAVGHLAAGTYIVQLRSSEGVANERLVIQR